MRRARPAAYSPTPVRARTRARAVALALAFLPSALVATGSASAQDGTGGGVPTFDFGRKVPRTDTPQPHEPPDFDRYRTRVRMAIDPGRLPQSLSKPLSDACSRDAFNQRKPGRFFVDVPMPNGPTVRLGYATSKGFNLRDPEGLSVEGAVYLFRYDGTSECRVYIIPR